MLGDRVACMNIVTVHTYNTYVHVSAKYASKSIFVAGCCINNVLTIATIMPQCVGASDRASCAGSTREGVGAAGYTTARKGGTGGETGRTTEVRSTSYTLP